MGPDEVDEEAAAGNAFNMNRLQEIAEQRNTTKKIMDKEDSDDEDGGGNGKVQLRCDSDSPCITDLGASIIDDARKAFGFFCPPPPCPHLELIYALNFTQPPLLHLLFHDPPSPPMQTSYLDAP